MTVAVTVAMAVSVAVSMRDYHEEVKLAGGSL